MDQTGVRHRLGRAAAMLAAALAFAGSALAQTAAPAAPPAPAAPRATPPAATATAARPPRQTASPPRGGTVVYATIDLKCSGGGTYTLSTGNSAGRCTKGTMPNPNGSGTIETMQCTDGKGNGAFATCAGGCASSDGAGSCAVKSPR